MRSFDDFSLTIALLKRAYAPKVRCHPESDNLQQILRDNPKLVVAMNHGPPAGPLAATIAVMDQYNKNGGDERKPVVIAWRGLYAVPVLRQAMRYITQIRRPPNFDGFVKKLTEEGFTDLFVMPEGENCTFGNGLDLEPFLSPRFIELALRANVPILLAAHVGSEHWSNILPLPDLLDFFYRKFPARIYEKIRSERKVNLPPWRIRKIPAIGVYFGLYHPQLTLAALNSPDGKAALEAEAEHVRQRLQQMIDQLKTMPLQA